MTSLPLKYVRYKWVYVITLFCKIRWHDQVQSNSEVYSSFASIFINQVINQGCVGASFGVVFISLLISEVRVVWKLGLVEKGKTLLRKILSSILRQDFFERVGCLQPEGQVLDKESILPNFFLHKSKIFSIFC